MAPLRQTFVLALLVAACGGANPGPGNCPNDLPKSCPANPPTYADAQPVIQKHCLSCHAPGGEKQDLPLDSYDALFAQRSSVLNDVYQCRMPKNDDRLTWTERATLLNWLVCGAPK